MNCSWCRRGCKRCSKNKGCLDRSSWEASGSCQLVEFLGFVGLVGLVDRVDFFPGLVGFLLLVGCRVVFADRKQFVFLEALVGYKHLTESWDIHTHSKSLGVGVKYPTRKRDVEFIQKREGSNQLRFGDRCAEKRRNFFE